MTVIKFLVFGRTRGTIKPRFLVAYFPVTLLISISYFQPSMVKFLFLGVVLSVRIVIS